MTKIRNFVRDNKGATAIEYGLIAALIAVAAITALSGTGSAVKKTFNNISNTMNTSVS